MTKTDILPTDPKALLEHLEQQGISFNELRRARREITGGNKPQRKHEKIDYQPLIIHPTGNNKQRWSKVLEHVKMGVRLCTATMNLPGEESEETTPLEAGYVTDSGRSGTYYFVAVDRNNDGNWRALSPVSDYYTVIKPESIYGNIKEFLDQSDMDYRVVSCYNSFSGGSQLLDLEINNLDSPNLDEKGNVKLMVTVKTSLDRSTLHSMLAWPTVDGSPVPLMLKDASFSLKHTSGAADRIIDANAAFTHLVTQWNEKIIPLMSFLGEMSETEMVGLLKETLKNAKLPRKHTEKLEMDFENGKAKKEGATGFVRLISEYADRGYESPMAKEDYREAVGKALANRLEKLYLKKLKK